MAKEVNKRGAVHGGKNRNSVIDRCPKKALARGSRDLKCAVRKLGYAEARRIIDEMERTGDR